MIRKIRLFIVATLVVSMMLTVSYTSVLASSGINEMDILPFDPNTDTSYTLISQLELDNMMLAGIEDFVDDSNNFSDESRESAREIIDTFPEENHIRPRGLISPTGDEIKDKTLSALCSNEGINAADMAVVWLQASLAGSDSEKFSTEGQRNAARHYCWNYRMAYLLGGAKARVVGVNYEWKDVLYPYIKDFYDRQVSSYIFMGYSESQARSRALEDVVNCSISLKRTAVQNCKNDYNYFVSLFGSNPDIYTDLWNNCYGRAGVNSYPSLLMIPLTAYGNAAAAGNLVLSPSYLTYDNKWCVWSWDWFS